MHRHVNPPGYLMSGGIIIHDILIFAKYTFLKTIHLMNKRISNFAVAIVLAVLLNALSLTAQGQSGVRGRFADSKNVLTLNGSIGGVGGFPAVSLALQYERFLTHDGNLSAVLSAARYYGGTLSFGSFESGDPARSKTSGYYAAPGVLYHFLGNTRRVDLAAGAAWAIGAAQRRDQYHRGGRLEKSTDDALFSALLAQMNIDFHAANGAVFGIFVHGGLITNDTHPTVPEADESKSGFFQLGIKLGGRW